MKIVSSKSGQVKDIQQRVLCISLVIYDNQGDMYKKLGATRLQSGGVIRSAAIKYSNSGLLIIITTVPPKVLYGMEFY